ncbi:cache domain-containing protein [Paenibacillus hexagrammi]|uniref:Cache domain-containing protein n=1 Tax=Paenibacillus hexagrammi TaxID=2908839 RepID=A0ABY3SGQ8_9BACL|nr:cache domain-containing protein [Paenibacillus sp. YPD9-1]UJF32379.1 cache domain-containing protein [Paenibacillus sp. YPD9-1]
MRGVRFFQFKSIHIQIAAAFSVLILCTTAILSFTAYKLSEDAVTNNSLEYTTELVKQVYTNVETYIQNIENISSLTLDNGDLKRYASMKNEHSEEDQLLETQIREYFHSIITSHHDITSIVFVSDDGGVVSDRAADLLKQENVMKEQEWYKRAVELQGQTAVSSSHVQNLYIGEYRWVVSISRQLPAHDGHGGGVLLVDLNYSVINNLCKQVQVGKHGYVFIIDPSGDLVYHPQQQIMNTQLKSERIEDILHAKDGTVVLNSGNERKIYTVSTTKFGWKIVGVIYPEDLAPNKRAMQLSTAYWGSLCLAIALILSFSSLLRCRDRSNSWNHTLSLLKKGTSTCVSTLKTRMRSENWPEALI